jgi:hypothetical protein
MTAMKKHFLLLMTLLLLPSLSMGATCYASSFSTLNSCIASNNTVEITANITLAANEQISLYGLSNVTINGNSYTITESSGRYAANNALSGAMVYIENASSIYLNDLVFSSPAVNSQCRNGGAYYFSYPCLAVIYVANSNTVQIDNVNINAHKTSNIIIANSSSNVQITNSDIANAATFNIWIAGSTQNSNITVTDNYIAGAGANGILVSLTNSIWVGNNTFSGNHWDTQYGGYGGGQVLLETHASGDLEAVDITGNSITAGASVVSYGVEIAAFENSTLDDLNIIWNYIDDHSYSAIHFVPRQATSDIRNVVINYNSLSNNANPPAQMALSSHAGVDIASYNNYSGGTTTTGNFNGTSKTCSLNGGSQCTISIQWSSTNITNPNVYVRSPSYGASRYLFASGTSGTQNASWISSSGAIFELVSGSSNYPVATINVTAVP